jgi:hypothetical protein
MRFVFAALVAAGALCAQTVSKWVYFDSHKRLQYGTDLRGNRIMDFSHAGYKGGGVRIPNVRVARRVAPEPGDNTARVQAALDEVARLPLDRDGFRGAVLLAPGVYEMGASLNITAGGVVLRGSGSGAGGTVIRMTGAPHRFLNIRGSGSWQTEGAPVPIADAYVPSGADSFTVSSTAGFKPGDTVLIRRPVTEAWIHFMKMDLLVRDGRPQTWIKPGTLIDADRTIRSISGNRVTLDAPLSDSYDARYLNPPGTVMVKYSFPGRISQAGWESMRIEAPARDQSIDNPQYTVMSMSAVSDAWARDIRIHETQNGITISQSARRVTLENVHYVHSLPFTSAAGPADFAISGTQILLDRSSVSGKGIWPVVTQAGVTGPNVILNFTCDDRGVSPHQRWATGLLVDNGVFRGNSEKHPGIAFSNRKHAGSGHGWTVGWAVAWNSKSDYMLIQQPPGTMNWCIGCTARMSTVSWDGAPVDPPPPVPSETFEHPGKTVSPASLYIEQLRRRLGEAAVRNIGYR